MNRKALNNIGVLSIGQFPCDDHVENSVDSQKEQVFNLIFAPDDFSGLPRNDIGVFLNEKTSPQVREFIQSQLHHDFCPKVSVPDGITDDDISYCTRKSNETVEDFAQRISNYMRYQKSVINKARSKLNSKK